MLCQNCGENEANFKYTQIINNIKKEMILCDKCAKELGLGSLEFNMPINLSSFLGEVFEEESNFLPNFINKKELICDECGMNYNEFINTGKFGCKNCYEIFSEKIDPILKNLHGGTRHIGRIEKVSKIQQKVNTKSDEYANTVTNKNIKKEDNEDKLEKLKKDLKIAIKEEKYEEAAKIRDEIKKIQN